MKRTVLTLSIGICVGLLGGSLSGAFAAVTETVEAQFAKFTLVINKGEPIEIEPLTYKGTTYLPVREAANLTGYDLTYKADIRTIELNKTIDSINAEYQKIIGTEGDPVTSGRSVEDQLQEINGSIESFNHGIDMANIQLQSAIDSGFTEETIQSIRDGITFFEQRVIDLQAKKAELEAQLEATPAQ